MHSGEESFRRNNPPPLRDDPPPPKTPPRPAPPPPPRRVGVLGICLLLSFFLSIFSSSVVFEVLFQVFCVVHMLHVQNFTRKNTIDFFSMNASSCILNFDETLKHHHVPQNNTPPLYTYWYSYLIKRKWHSYYPRCDERLVRWCARDARRRRSPPVLLCLLLLLLRGARWWWCRRCWKRTNFQRLHIIITRVLLSRKTRCGKASTLRKWLGLNRRK